MTKRAYSVNGRVIALKSGARIDLISDCLGSVTSTVGSDGVVQNSYRYRPFGSRLSKTGAGLDPPNTWVGRLGYRSSGLRHAEFYVRFRHYGSIYGSWTSPDFIPSVSPYVYCEGRPTYYVDPSGMLPATCSEGNCCCCPISLSLKLIRRIGPSTNFQSGSPLITDPYFGHWFEVVFGVVYVPWDRGYFGDCTLIWDEMSPEGLPTGEKGGEWVDQNNKKGKPDPNFDPGDWKRRQKKCSSFDSGKITDIPGVFKSKWENSRTPRASRLYIQPKVRAAPGCPCAVQEVNIRITHWLGYFPNETTVNPPNYEGPWVNWLSPPDSLPPYVPQPNPPWR